MVQTDGLSIREEGWLLGTGRAVVWKLHWYMKEKVCLMAMTVLRVREMAQDMK